MIGRLKPGATVAQAQAEIRTLAGQITTEHPERNSFEGHIKSLAEQVSGRIRLAVWVLAGAVGMVMLIVCANLSNLLLARTASRQRELAIRSALGAGRATTDCADVDREAWCSRAAARSSGWCSRSAERAHSRSWTRSAFPCCAASQTDATALGLHGDDGGRRPGSSSVSRRRSRRAARRSTSR